MANNNYSITFKSLRAGTTYVLSIGGGSGTAIPLKGGSQPFTTDEDADEDQFKPIRTQTGYFRIVDDGLDANGNAFDWKDLIPATDTSRPVTLTAGGVVMWTGFMQAQNFGGVLYGNPQEREFPVQCILSVLGTYKASTSVVGMNNFAWLLKWLLVDNMPADQRPTSFIIQGGADARQWLLKRFDWMNFMNEVEDGDIEPRYSHYDIMEDFCKFWGWTIRTHRKTVYMTCTDDSMEKNRTLSLDQTSLAQLAADTTGQSTAGTVTNTPMTVLSVPNAFASTSNDTYQNQGPSKATVKADVNQHETVLKFAPSSVRKTMEENGWTWVQEPEQDLVGYFETHTIDSFDSQTMSGTSVGTYGGFCRRQVYTTKETDKPQNCDMFLFNHQYDGSAVVSIRSKIARSFAGGSLKLGGTVYFNSKVCDEPKNTKLFMRLGIGQTRETARWWFMEDVVYTNVRMNYGWSASGSIRQFAAGGDNGDIKSTRCFVYLPPGVFGYWVVYTPTYDAIPVPNDASFNGYLFIDFLGFGHASAATADAYEYNDIFQIANFEIEFSRDTYDIPTNLDEVRPREIKEERATQREYTAENNSRTIDEWNADCIFASDNNMEYGYGLLMNATGTFMATAPYNGSASPEHPEQHLANRVASFWQRSRRRVTIELQSQATINNVAVLDCVTPGVLLSVDGATGHPIAISHDWRDDVEKITILEMP